MVRSEWLRPFVQVDVLRIKNWLDPDYDARWSAEYRCHHFPLPPPHSHTAIAGPCLQGSIFLILEGCQPSLSRIIIKGTAGGGPARNRPRVTDLPFARRASPSTHAAWLLYPTVFKSPPR